MNKKRMPKGMHVRNDHHGDGECAACWPRSTAMARAAAEADFARRKELAELASGVAVPMILHCPACGERHIDRGAFAMKRHHTHACQHCGFVWRPAIIATVGVQFLPGYKDPVTL